MRFHGEIVQIYLPGRMGGEMERRARKWNVARTILKLGRNKLVKNYLRKTIIIIIYFLLFSLHPPSAEHPFHLHVRSFVERFGGNQALVERLRALLSVQHRERALSSSRWNFGVVEIYDVSNVLAVPIDYPIVSIER